jgi:hypothetical protein
VDMLGYIATADLADSYIEHPAEVVAADETVLGRITEINKQKFHVRVTYALLTIPISLLFSLLTFLFLSFSFFLVLFFFFLFFFLSLFFFSF